MSLTLLPDEHSAFIRNSTLRRNWFCVCVNVLIQAHYLILGTLIALLYMRTFIVCTCFNHSYHVPSIVIAHSMCRLAMGWTAKGSVFEFE